MIKSADTLREDQRIANTTCETRIVLIQFAKATREERNVVIRFAETTREKGSVNCVTGPVRISRSSRRSSNSNGVVVVVVMRHKAQTISLMHFHLFRAIGQRTCRCEPFNLRSQVAAFLVLLVGGRDEISFETPVHACDVKQRGFHILREQGCGVLVWRDSLAGSIPLQVAVSDCPLDFEMLPGRIESTLALSPREPINI